MKIQIGEKVFLRPTGNISRYNTIIKEGVITKIGRKYFYIGNEKFSIETLENINEDCNSAWVLYFSKQEILDEDEKKLLLDKLKILFSWTGEGKSLSLNQLKKIDKIVKLD